MFSIICHYVKLNNTHIRILSQLSRREYESIVALGTDLRMIPSTLDMSLVTLRDMGFVEMTRNGRSVRVGLSCHKHAGAYRKLVTLHPHMGFEDILSRHNIRIMIILLQGRSTVKDLAGKLGVSSRTVERSVRTLLNYGMVRNEDGSYLLNEQHGMVYEFIGEYQAYMNMKMARASDPGATVIWENLEEFIMESPNPVKQEGFYATGYRTLGLYGITLLTDNRYHYFHSPYKRDIRLEDVCLHILAIDPSSVRGILYISLAIVNNRNAWDWKYLEAESRTYQLDDMTGRLRRYIENRGKVRDEGIPSWDELKEKAGVYDIDVQ